MNRTIRIALTLLMAVLTTFTVQATDFITDVMLIGHADKTEFNNLLNTYKNQGWKVIDYDLNKGCGTGSAYINLLYKSESNSDGFNHGYITDFYIKTGKNPPGSLTYDGRTYQRVSCKGSSDFVNGYGDLNDGCGSGSEYIYLFFTKGTFSDNRAVTSIYFNDTQNGAVGANGGSTGYDLNKGCGSESPYIYMHFTTGTAVPPMSGSGTTESPYIIGSTADWTKFVTYIGDGLNTDKCYKLTANISVTTMVGTSGQPFKGTFDGGGKTLTINLSGSDQGVAPFHYINGATIKDLKVSGSVSSTNKHAAGLVGFCSGGTITIDGCAVTANVDGGSSNYAGGIVGHGKSSTLTIQNSYYSGTISNFSYLAGGLLGWSDENSTLTMYNCLFKGSFSPSGSGKYHPIACTYNSNAVTATASKIYYLNTVTPTAPGNKIIPEAAGIPVSTTFDIDNWNTPIKAVDGITYYANNIPTVVTIGDGTWSTLSFPFALNANFSLSQQIYTAEEIGMAGTISSISFSCNESFSMVGVQVYLKHTDKSAFADENDVVPISASDKVFEGTYAASEAGWATITLDTPFEYDGNSNLLVCCLDPTHDNDWISISLRFYYFGTNNTSTLRYFSNSTVPDIDNLSQYSDMVTSKNRNNIQLNIIPTIFAHPANLHVSSCTEEMATLTWETPATNETITGYAYQYKKDSDANWSNEVTLGSTTTSATINGLSAATDYQFRVRTLYGDRYSSYALLRFTTAVELPYECGFEDGMDGWSVVNLESNFGGGIKADAAHDGEYGFSFGSTSKPPQYLISPRLPSTSGITASFYYLDWYVSFQVGYSTTNNDISAFTWGEEQEADPDPTWRFIETNFPVGTTYIAIKYNAIGNVMYFDDFRFTSSSYAKPADLRVSSCTEEKATLAWEAPETEETITGYAYQFKKDSDSQWSNEATLGSTTTSATINGLSAATDYQFRVRALYGTNVSTYALLSFTSAVTLPYECGFEDGFDGWGLWDINWGYTGISSNARRSGENGFMFRSSIDGPQYLISPRLPGTSDIIVSFYYRDRKPDSGFREYFQVGYSKKTNDINDFEWRDRDVYYATNKPWTLCESYFPEGTKYIAIRYNSTYTSGLYIDDIVIDESSSFDKPYGLAASALTDQTATLTWLAPSYSVTGYAFIYKKDTETNWSKEITVTETSVTIGNLTANTTYDFRLKALYFGGNSSNYASLKFTTEGHPETLPYAYGFEDGMSSWRIVDGNLDTGIYSKEATFIHSGEKSFMFFSPEILGSAQYLISPELANSPDMKVSFWFKCYLSENVQTNASFKVGYSTTTKDLDAFTWEIQEFANNDGWQEYITYFPAGTKYVAIKRFQGNFLYVDDFSFTASVIPATPSQLTATNLTSTTADLSWTGDAETYQVRYRTAPLFFEDFENGISEWKVVNQGGTANTNWQLEYMEIDKNHYAGAASYDGPTEEFYTVDNWLISPQVNLSGTLKYMTAQTIEYPVHYEVLLSTTTDDLSAFTTTLATPKPPKGDLFEEYTIDLSSYQGQKGYIAFRLKENAENQRANLGIDNVGIYPDNYNTIWKFINTTGKSTTVTGLQPFTSYEFQVQTIVTNYYSPWSDAATFTTNYIIPLADDADNTEAIAAIADDKTHDVMLKGRKFWKDDDWNTLCLPFGVSSFTGTPLEGADVRTLQSATFANGTLTLNFSNKLTSIEAGKPYIVKWAETTPNYVENPVFNGVTITCSSPTDVTSEAANFHGIFNPFSTGGEDKTMLYLGADKTLYYPTDDMTINAFRAYFTLNGITAGDASGDVSIKAFVLNFGEETGIRLMEDGRGKMDDAWYSIDGRRLSGKPDSKGIYIHDGKKVIIK